MSENQLHLSHSAYLKQHQNNPVAWQPWNKEALQRAKSESKPIFLSIGYSSCHWCHVMEQESFSRPEVAEVLNKHFIPIKLDREERPDIDALYMKAVQAMTGQGGWPLNIFLTPELRPFFGGTYFPPEPRHGRPGFIQLLNQIKDAYEQQPDEVKKNADSLVNILVQAGRYFEPKDKIDNELRKRCLSNLVQLYDSINGGFGQAPKFFYADAYRILMQEYQRTKDEALLEMVERSVQKIYCGGIYDQVGGGLHRYSTDNQWLVPHFEKMLYDNALMSEVLVELWQITKNKFYKTKLQETLNWVTREMRSLDGLFFSAMDADSEHVEGKFYVWSREELVELGASKDFLKDFLKDFSVNEGAQFEGMYILHSNNPLPDEAYQVHRPFLDKLLSERSKRVWPLIDKKAQVSWNALMISSFAKAGFALEKPTYLETAELAFKSLWSKAWDESKGLSHVVYDQAVTDEAFLEDYAYLSQAALHLFEVTGKLFYFEALKKLLDKALDDFYDQDVGGFWSSSSEQDDLLMRSKEVLDSAIPSAYSQILKSLIQTYELTGDAKYSEAFESSVKFVLGSAEAQCGGFNSLSLALEEYFQSTVLIAVQPSANDLKKMRQYYLGPGVQVCLFDLSNQQEFEKKISALKGKLDSSPSFYRCQAGGCQSPVSRWSELMS